MFWLLDFFGHGTGNFGIAILLLTIVVRLVFFPLANTQFKSMSRMKKLQPHVERIRERFAEDKMRQQQEMMELYKREKVNPLSGCLPIFIQIPVFFSLYKVLLVTIEMRQAPFFGWIHDLSAPDPTSIWNLFGLLPWHTPALIPAFLVIGIWPILMGMTQWLQTKMNPAPADPVQARMFGLMPLIFMFMLANFPAGLVIYWTWNNLLSMIQQYVIMRREGAEIHLFNNLKLTPIAQALVGPGAGSASGRMSGAGWATTRSARASCSPAPANSLLAPRHSKLCPKSDLPEIAFVGRSNVGKSSLINALLGRSALARVSHTPGRTRQINLFRSSRSADAGGLAGLWLRPRFESGSAQLERSDLRPIFARANLRRVVLLIDARRGAMTSDEQVMDLLDEAAVAFVTVLTKADAVTSAEIEAVRAAVTQRLDTHPASLAGVIATSRRTGDGHSGSSRSRLRNWLRTEPLSRWCLPWVIGL